MKALAPAERDGAVVSLGAVQYHLAIRDNKEGKQATA